MDDELPDSDVRSRTDPTANPVPQAPPSAGAAIAHAPSPDPGLQ